MHYEILKKLQITNNFHLDNSNVRSNDSNT